MEAAAAQIRAFRVRAHHLDRKLLMSALLEAAGVCGLQNSPPGAWETALFNRLEGCAPPALEVALYEEKTLLQAWSFRGAPVVFPTEESGVFLTALAARPGEEPWIYTMGLSAALEFMGMPFDDLLARVAEAAACLDREIVRSKEALDRTLSRRVWAGLPEGKRALWDAPSLYGSPETQTMGDAAVSFLLRPCSFLSLVVFGRREGTNPTFTSYQNWIGRAPDPAPGAERELVRRFLHAYGPATPGDLMSWLGCSRAQARRLWDAAAEEMEPVSVEGKTRYLLSEDREALLHAGEDGDRLLLLGAHDPYLDCRDREVLLEDRARWRTVWRTVANPGVVLKGGRVAGVWRARTRGGGMDLIATFFQPLDAGERRALEELAGAYAAFRRLELKAWSVEAG